jgi:hypothetical protein
MDRNSSTNGERRWAADEAPGTDALRLRAVRISAGGQVRGTFGSSEQLSVELEFMANTSNPGLCVGFDLADSLGSTAFRSYQTDLPAGRWPVLRPGLNRWRCLIPPGLLNGGGYSVCPRIGIHNVEWIVQLDSVVRFEVTLDHGASPLWNSLGFRNRPGLVAPILEWSAGDE